MSKAHAEKRDFVQNVLAEEMFRTGGPVDAKRAKDAIRMVGDLYAELEAVSFLLWEWYRRSGLELRGDAPPLRQMALNLYAHYIDFETSGIKCGRWLGTTHDNPSYPFGLDYNCERPVMHGGPCRPKLPYRNLGNRAVTEGSAIGLSCHHCLVEWGGCAAGSCCPQCGAPKGYHDSDWDFCYCEKCRPDLHDYTRDPVNQPENIR